MTTEQFSTFFGLLAFLAIAIGLIALVAAVFAADERSQPIRPLLLPVAFAVAATAMAGSLYYSESANFTPCLYCWYQRICMYPLVAITAVGMLRKDRQWAWYALPLSVVGLGISIYHYQLQLFPDQGTSCDASAPCTAQWVDNFGFMSIPFMAGAGFLAITGVAVLSLRLSSDATSERELDELAEPLPSEVMS